MGAGEYDRLYDERSIDLDPFEWSEMFRRAEHVITGTFHGAVFSMINGRNISVCPNNPTRAEKLRSLLAEFGLSECLVEPEKFDIARETARRINYGRVNEIIARRVSESKEYLKKALEG